jgi:transposase
MTVTLNHTIVHARDKAARAKFLTEILGLALPKTLPHFTVVQVGEMSLDFLETDEKIRMPIQPAAEQTTKDKTTNFRHIRSKEGYRPHGQSSGTQGRRGRSNNCFCRGHPARFLPAYSPELSPLENAWLEIRQTLRRVAARQFRALTRGIKEALESVIAADARDWFQHCEYRIDNA